MRSRVTFYWLSRIGYWVSDLLVNFFVIVLRICNVSYKRNFILHTVILHDGKSVCVHVAQQNAQFEAMVTLYIVKWASLKISFSLNMSAGAMTSWTRGRSSYSDSGCGCVFVGVCVLFDFVTCNYTIIVHSVKLTAIGPYHPQEEPSLCSSSRWCFKVRTRDRSHCFRFFLLGSNLSPTLILLTGLFLYDTIAAKN